MEAMDEHSVGEGRDATIDKLRGKMAAIEACPPPSPKERVASDAAREKSLETQTTPAERKEEGEDAASVAYRRVVFLCSYSDYSRIRMKKRLEREGVDADAIASALDRAVLCGLIDDIRYAESLIAGRMRKGKGRDAIEDELLENGIDPAVVEGWPEEYLERYGDEVSRALSLLEKHPPRSQNPRDSAYRRLLGKGYSSKTASEAAGLWCASHDS